MYKKLNKLFKSIVLNPFLRTKYVDVRVDGPGRGSIGKASILSARGFRMKTKAMAKTKNYFTKRGRLGIIYEILSICSKAPTKKTHIMYKANLSYDQLRKYLNLLINMQLLEEHTTNNGKKYHINGKGRRFKNEFQKLQNLLDFSVSVRSTRLR